MKDAITKIKAWRERWETRFDQEPTLLGDILGVDPTTKYYRLTDIKTKDRHLVVARCTITSKLPKVGKTIWVEDGYSGRAWRANTIEVKKFKKSHHIIANILTGE